MAISTPTVTISVDGAPHYGIRLQINNPSSSPSAIRNEVERRKFGESTWELLKSDVSPNSAYVDAGAASEQQYQYRVRAFAADNSSAVSSITNATGAKLTEWLFKDLTANETIVVDIANSELDWESPEVQAAFNTIGGKYPLVVKDRNVKGAKWTPIFDFLDKEVSDQFEVMRARQRGYLLQAPFLGLQWFFVFDTDGRWRVRNPHTPWLQFTCTIIEVERF